MYDRRANVCCVYAVCKGKTRGSVYSVGPVYAFVNLDLSVSMTDVSVPLIVNFYFLADPTARLFDWLLVASHWSEGLLVRSITSRS